MVDVYKYFSSKKKAFTKALQFVTVFFSFHSFLLSLNLCQPISPSPFKRCLF